MAFIRATSGSGGGGGSSNIKMGYIAPSELTFSQSADYTISDLGFTPKQIVWCSIADYPTVYYYDANKSTTMFYGMQGTYNLRSGASIGGSAYWNGLKDVGNGYFKIQRFNNSYSRGIFWVATPDTMFTVT